MLGMVRKIRKASLNISITKRKHPLLNEAGALVTKNAEKAEVLNAFFPSIFTAKAIPQ